MTVREEQGNLKQTVYITSDRKRFRDRSEADVHEKYLGWAQKVQQLGIKENNGAYYCETEKQFNTVLLMLMYQKGFYNWKKQKWTPMESDCSFEAKGWYRFEAKEMLITSNYEKDLILSSQSRELHKVISQLKGYDHVVDFSVLTVASKDRYSLEAATSNGKTKNLDVYLSYGIYTFNLW